ncbi:hypothetical protein [Janibacter limosus]|uniref:DUF308 domain-containing protein n=1 Tax=Janibacter limosus TaxID=53458 RepID=A0A4V0ZAZ1_9MICO|nr:hypothetical protein [Janibacter limosus]QBF46178.1 hypothetical protein EXU32_07880 [Janibacter limosus]
MDEQMTERQHPDDRDVDAAFEAMVAHWDEPTPDEDLPDHDRLPAPLDTPPRRPRQTTAGVHGAFPPPRPVDRQRNDVPWRVDPTNSVADALMGSDDDPGSADDDEGFQPPPPAPLPPSTDRLFWGALLGLGLGILGLLWLAIARPYVGSWVTFLVVASIIGGFVCLVIRQPQDRDDDPTNGARV